MKARLTITLIALTLVSILATVLYIEKSEIENQLEQYKKRTRRHKALSSKKYITIDRADRNYIKLMDIPTNQ